MAEPTQELGVELVESWSGFFLERIASGHRRATDPTEGFDEFLADTVAFAAVGERREANWDQDAFESLVAQVQAGLLESLAKSRP